MTADMFFGDFQGAPVPLMQFDGTPPLVVDGQSVRSLQQAIEHYGEPEEHLAGLWAAFFKQYLERQDAPPGSATNAAAAQRERMAELLFRRMHYPDMDDADYTLFMSKCARLNLSPWKKQVYPVWRFNQRTRKREMDVEITIGGALCVAHRTGQLVGMRAVTFEMDGEQICSATARLFKLTAGKKRLYEATVFWTDRYPGRGVSEFWDTKGRTMLGKCAKMALLRDAFPEELHGIYCAEEVAQAPTGQERQPAAPEDRDVQAKSAPFNMGHGMTFSTFCAELEKVGFVTHDQRTTLIRRLRSEFPAICDGNAPHFYAVALEAIRTRPEKYGAKVS